MGLQSARLGLPFLAAGQAQKETTHNEALALIDAAIGGAVESAGVEAPPAEPEPGQCWLVGETPTGAWAGQPEALACWTGSGWRFLPPREGMQLWVKDAALWTVRESAGWTMGTVRGARLLIDGLQLVGERGDPVAAPAGGAVVDSEARTAIAAIIARLVAHGLIGP